MKIPHQALRYILFQKPRLRNRKIFNKLPLSYQHVSHLEVLLRSRQIRKTFSSKLQEEYEDIKDGLPPQTTQILDIGCGVGGIDVLLFHHYGSKPHIHFWLLDRTEISQKVHYGFHENAAFYNSLDAASAMLKKNSISPSKIHCLNADNDGRISIPDQSVDLVLSLSSWGFHYPIQTYKDEVYRIMKSGASLILDIRKETGGEKELLTLFPSMRILKEHPKMLRAQFLKK